MLWVIADVKVMWVLVVMMLMGCVKDVGLESDRCDPNPCGEPHKKVCSIDDDDRVVCSCDDGYIDNGGKCVQCTGGVCCSSDGLFKSENEKCDSWYVYRCNGGGCGGFKTQRKEVSRYCNAKSPECTGLTQEDEDWLDINICSGERDVCILEGTNPAQCVKCDDACCGGVCCEQDEICRYNQVCGQTAGLDAHDTDSTQQFGYAVALDGDYLVVGAPGAKNATEDAMGAAYIFHRIGPNRWDKGFKVTAEADAKMFAQFGETVAIQGDYVLIGAPQDNFRGAAYVFRRTGENSWTRSARFTRGDQAQPESYFGCSVAIKGDYVLIGAKYESVDEVHGAGAAYVYQRLGQDAWSQAARLTVGANPEAGAQFGHSVAMGEGYLLVGAPNEDTLQNGAGAAYVFKHQGGNSWTNTAKLTAGIHTESFGGFGFAVASSHQYALIGAHAESSYAGSCYVFKREQDGAWDQGRRLTAGSNSQDDAGFGYSLDIGDDYIVVGAPFESDDVATIGSGAAYVFVNNSENTWQLHKRIVAEMVVAGDNFGYSGAVDQNHVVIGVPYSKQPSSGQEDVGHVFVY